MSADRRRLIAIVAALTLFTALGAFWLIRLVAGNPRAQPVPAASEQTADRGSAGTPSLPTSDGATATASTPPATGDPTTGTRTTVPGRPSSPGTATSRSIPPPPIPVRAIRVGGATLNNENPRTMCLVFTNLELGLTVRVTGAGVSGDILKVDPGECATDDNINKFPECVGGMELRPGGACFAGALASTTTPGEYRGVLSLNLRARCTTTSVAACDVAELKDSPPSPARPVDITWTDPGRRVCYAVLPADQTPSPFCDPDQS